MSPAAMPPDLTPKLAAALDAAHTLEVAALLILAGLGLTATLLLLRTGMTRMVRRFDDAAESRPGWRRFAVGALNALGLLLLAIALGSHPSTKPLGVFFFAVWVVISAFGLTAEAARIGRCFLQLAGRESNDGAGTVVGGLILTGTLLLPFLGWAALAGLLVRATGTGVFGLFTRPPRRTS
jgi:hypothetical protein